jgi:hypothetical protein
VDVDEVAITHAVIGSVAQAMARRRPSLFGGAEPEKIISG